MKKSILLTSCLLFVLIFQVNAQNESYRNRTVKIKSGTYTYKYIFKLISTQTGVVFSYTQFNDLEKKSVYFDEKPLQFVLEELFKTSKYHYKIKGKYIILTLKPEKTINLQVEISGYVMDVSDSSALSGVSIFVKENKYSTFSNKLGFFKFNFPVKSEDIYISFAKENFRDTTIIIPSKKKTENMIVYLFEDKNNIILTAKYPKSEDLSSDSVKINEPKPILIQDTPRSDLKKFKTLLDTLLPKAFKNFNFKNINDTLFTNVAFSLVPAISTNRLLSINTVNRVSFNILSGYSKGIDLMEIGGGINIDNGNVKYLQIAGLVNLVSGNVNGLQIGGLANIVGGNFSGIQAAGLINRSDTIKGMQTSFLMNKANIVKGAQLSTLMNIAKDVEGLQFSFLINKADIVNGLQFSGFLNTAKEVKGVQMAVLNISNYNKGIPIGFFSYVHHGYHKIEFGVDEQLCTNISFRTGVDLFHNIFLLGKNFNQDNYWTVGYGIGSALSFTKNKKWYLNIDFIYQQIIPTQLSYSILDIWNKFFIGLEYRPMKKVNFILGPTWNLLLTDDVGFKHITITNTIPIPYHGNSNSDIMWIGGKFAVRFL